MDAAAMEIYDIIMLVVLLSAIAFGAIKGFAWQLASILSIVASYVVAYRFREPFSQSIQADPPWNRVLAMLILFVGTSLLIWVAFRMVHGTMGRLKLKEFDRHVGAMFGLAKGLLYCLLITLFAVTLFGDRTREKVLGSKSGRYIAHALDRSGAVIPPEIHEVVGPYLEKVNRQLNPTAGETGPWIAQDQLGGPLAGEQWNGGAASPPLPIEPRQWLPQQAQQPKWNGLQR
jgi:membrane protein required for colicin V production